MISNKEEIIKIKFTKKNKKKKKKKKNIEYIEYILRSRW